MTQIKVPGYFLGWRHSRGGLRAAAPGALAVGASQWENSQGFSPLGSPSTTITRCVLQITHAYGCVALPSGKIPREFSHWEAPPTSAPGAAARKAPRECPPTKQKVPGYLYLGHQNKVQTHKYPDTSPPQGLK